jgi:hypothetical protein
VKIVVALVVVAAVAVGGFFLFEYFDHRDKVQAAKRACGSSLVPTPGVALPSGLAFTLPSGQTLLSVAKQGKTEIIFAITPGNREDLVTLRDKVVSDLKGQGYTASATDQEPTYEAEGQFSGKASGTIQVQPECEGYNRIRYKFNL